MNNHMFKSYSSRPIKYQGILSRWIQYFPLAQCNNTFLLAETGFGRTWIEELNLKLCWKDFIQFFWFWILLTLLEITGRVLTLFECLQMISQWGLGWGMFQKDSVLVWLATNAQRNFLTQKWPKKSQEEPISLPTWYVTPMVMNIIPESLVPSWFSNCKLAKAFSIIYYLMKGTKQIFSWTIWFWSLYKKPIWYIARGWWKTERLRLDWLIVGMLIKDFVYHHMLDLETNWW